MNINLMKQLADLKKMNVNLGSQLNAKIEATVNHLFNLSLDDFEDFFTTKGFQVQKDQRNAIATCGNLKASLTSRPNEGYFVYTCVCDLIIGQEKYIVTFSSNQSGIAATANCLPKDPDERLMQEIGLIIASNERALNRINNYDNEQWHLVLKPQTKGKRALKTATLFPTMYELLTSLTTEPT